MLTVMNDHLCICIRPSYLSPSHKSSNPMPSNDVTDVYLVVSSDVAGVYFVLSNYVTGLYIIVYNTSPICILLFLIRHRCVRCLFLMTSPVCTFVVSNDVIIDSHVMFSNDVTSLDLFVRHEFPYWFFEIRDKFVCCSFLTHNNHNNSWCLHSVMFTDN